MIELVSLSILTTLALFFLSISVISNLLYLKKALEQFSKSRDNGKILANNPCVFERQLLCVINS